MTPELDTENILADLEAFYADPPATHSLTLEEQAQLCMLVWEISGHVKALRSTPPRGNAAAACTNLERAARQLMTLLDPGEPVLDLAQDMVDALPWGGRKQALLLNRHGRIVTKREYEAGVSR